MQSTCDHNLIYHYRMNLVRDTDHANYTMHGHYIFTPSTRLGIVNPVLLVSHMQLRLVSAVLLPPPVGVTLALSDGHE